MAHNGPYLPNLEPIIAAGIDPRTGLPLKMGGAKCLLKEDIKRALRVKDEQEAVRRFVWYNLPSGLTGDLLERILYYKGQAAFFYLPQLETFYFLPYALTAKNDTGIDPYGRFKMITPVVMGSADGKERPLVEGLTRDVKYSFEDIVLNGADPEKSAIILRDYTNQLSQTNISRQVLNDSVLDAMAECFPMSRTNLFANSGIKGLRVDDEDQQASVKAANNSIQRSALTGDMFIPIIGNTDFQDLTAAGTSTKTDEFLQHMQALDNFRLSLYGLKNGGLFEKKAQMLQAEQALNAGNTDLVFQDSLLLRQEFCDMVNAIWELGIWCEPSEIALGQDTNMDGKVTDEKNDFDQLNAAYNSGISGGNDDM